MTLLVFNAELKTHGRNQGDCIPLRITVGRGKQYIKNEHVNNKEID